MRTWTQHGPERLGQQRHADRPMLLSGIDGERQRGVKESQILAGGNNDNDNNRTTTSAAADAVQLQDITDATVAEAEAVELPMERGRIRRG